MALGLIRRAKAINITKLSIMVQMLTLCIQMACAVEQISFFIVFLIRRNDKMKKRIFTLVMGFVLIFGGVMTVQADSFVAPEPFYVISQDASKIFHVTPASQWDNFDPA